MDPEDVLDFEEDDEGLDVISLGGSDHDGRPVSNRSSSTIPDYASSNRSNSRHTPDLRPPSPSRSRRLKSPHPPPSGSDRSGRESTRARDHPRGPLLGRRIHAVSSSSDRPTSKAERPARETSSRGSHRYTGYDSNQGHESTRTRDRPRPGERASYMPPDRLQALANSSRTSNTVKSSTEAKRPPPILSTRITDHRDIDPIDHRDVDPAKHQNTDHTDHRDVDLKTDASLSLSKSKPDKSEEKEEVKNSEESPVDSPADKQLPEGWISRMSKAGKTYYVNVLTRTSQWARPTQPAVDKQSESNSKVASKSSVRQPVSERLDNRTDQTQANVQPDLTVLAQNSSMVSRSQKHRPDHQHPSQSLDDSSHKLRLSSKPVSLDDPPSAKSLEQSQHPETYKTFEHANRPPNAGASGSTQGSDKDISTRYNPQEIPHSAISEPYSRGPQVHPDRRQGIVLVSSHREWDNAPNLSKVSTASSFHRDLPSSSDSKIREDYRRGEFVRYPQEIDSFRPCANPRPRSISPDHLRVSSYRQSECHPREPIHLSGANGVPKAPGRSFPDRIPSSKSATELLESSRYSKSTSIPSIPAREREGHRNADWWRGPHDNSLSRSVPSQDYGPANWPSRNIGPASPGRYSHSHRLHSRARSPSPPPRRITSHQHFDDGPPPPDFYISGRSRPLPASSYMLREDRLSRTPESSDLLRRNTTSRGNVHMPPSPSSIVTSGLRLHDSRRGDAYPPRDQGPQNVERREMEHRRSHVARISDLPAVSVKADFYRPPPRDVIARNISHSPAPPSKHCERIDVDDAIGKDETSVRSRTEQNRHHLSSKTSHSSVSQGADRSQNPDTRKALPNDVDPCTYPPPEMAAPEAYERNKSAYDPSYENSDTNGVKTSSDIIEMSLLQETGLPQQIVSLAKRLGPVVADSSECDKLTPPTKRHRRNPVEQNEVQDGSQTVADNSTVSPSKVEKNSTNNPAPDSNDTSGRISSQVRAEEPSNQIKGFPEVAPSLPQHHDKVISLRGRAARKSRDVGVAREESMVDDVSTSEPTPLCGGSLRDRIQDLNVTPVHRTRPRQFSHIDSSAQSPATTHLHESRQVQSRIENGPPTSRHISERISGFRAPFTHSSSSNGNHRSPRFAPRQSDSGWSGRKARYP